MYVYICIPVCVYIYIYIIVLVLYYKNCIGSISLENPDLYNSPPNGHESLIRIQICVINTWYIHTV